MCVCDVHLPLIARAHILQNIAFKSSFSFEHNSFELFKATLSLEKRSVNIFCLFRPPPNRKNKLTDSLFIEQLFAFLEYCNSITGCLFISGDFNFHFDRHTNQHMSKILDLLKILNLAQSINLPTYTHGHILDWTIYHPDDNILMSSSVSNELTSDHFALLCSLDLRIPDSPSIKSSFCNIKCIDRHQLA